MIAFGFFYFIYYFLFCRTAVFQIRALAFFRKYVALMHFKSLFSKHNGISPQKFSGSA